MFESGLLMRPEKHAIVGLSTPCSTQPDSLDLEHGGFTGSGVSANRLKSMARTNLRNGRPPMQ